MPDNTLYWFGYMSGDCVECSTANGFSFQDYGFGSLVYNTNYLFTNSSNRHWAGISSSNPITEAVTAYAIGQTVTVAYNSGGYLGAFPSKSIVEGQQTGSLSYTGTSLQMELLTCAVAANNYIVYESYAPANVTRTSNCYALWYE